MKSIQDSRLAGAATLSTGGVLLNLQSGEPRRRERPVRCCSQRQQLQPPTTTITITTSTLHPSRANHCNLARSSSGDRMAASRDAGKEDQENNAVSQSPPPTSPSRSLHIAPSRLGEDTPRPRSRLADVPADASQTAASRDIDWVAPDGQELKGRRRLSGTDGQLPLRGQRPCH